MGERLGDISGGRRVNHDAPNLAPAPWLRARREHRRRRLWAVLLSIYGLAALGSAGAALAAASTVEGPGADELRAARRESADATALLRERDAQLATSRRALLAARAVRTPPDWSLLLTYLAHTCGDRVRLGGVSITPVPTGVIEVELSGAAAELADVSGLLERLDGAGLFARTSLRETARAANAAPDADGPGLNVSFSIVCEIGTPRPPATPPTRGRGATR